MKTPPFPILIENTSESESEILKIGSHGKGADIMKDKAVFYTIKIKELTPPQANIIKQELLSFGADAATSFGAISYKVKKTDVLMFATLSQYKRLVKKLKENYFSLPDIAREIEKAIKNYGSAPSKRTQIMGIVNVTPDSFSDGGKYYDPDKAIEHAHKLISDGADIIDIGGESTRPGAKTVPEKEELERILPVIKAISNKCVVSVDTRKSNVAKVALRNGAQIINDISALRYDKKMADVISYYKAGVVLMHIKGTPLTMQKNPQYNDLLYEVLEYLKNSIEIAREAGILTDRIIVDPGFGFGKTLKHNLDLLKNLKTFKALGCPILAGTSRKSMIGEILNMPEEERLFGTAATIAVAILNGANIIRVHDVAEMKQVAQITDAIVRRDL